MSASVLAQPSVTNLGVGLDQRVRVNAACFFLAMTAVLFALSAALLRDPDSHWHVAVGRQIWEAGALPWTDPYSHTFQGAPWIAKEWLSQIIFFGAYSAAGWSGVAFLAAVTIALSFALLFGRLQEHLKGTVALAAVLVTVILAAPHFLARPHVLTYPFLVLWVGGLADAAERRSPPWALLPLVALWVNLHGSVTIAPVLAALFAAEGVLAAPRGTRLHAALRWGSFLAATVLALCVSPYGVHAALVTATLFGSTEARRYIQEWQPLDLDTPGLLALGVLALLVVGLSLRFRPNLFRILVVGLFGAMMIRHVRFVSLFAMVAPLAAVAPLARRFPGLAPDADGPPPALPKPLLAAVLAVIAGFALTKDPRPSPSTTPAAALRTARGYGLTGPVYNDYNFGGFLIASGVPTFIDGRADQLFLGGFITEVTEADAAEDHRRFAALLDRHGVTWALVKAKDSGARHLDALPGWTRIHADAEAAVYAKAPAPPRD